MTSTGASVSFFFGGIISMFVLKKTKIHRTHLRKLFEGVSKLNHFK